MSGLTPQFVFDLESNMRTITENEYVNLVTSGSMWWQKVARRVPSMSRKEIVAWVLNTAMLEITGELGGRKTFEDMVMLTTEFTPEHVEKGLRLHRDQFKDLDGSGIQLAQDWSAQMGAQFGYWPQRSVATFMKSTTVTSYDGKTFFAADHPLNPKRASAGTYSNRIATVPIDASVTADTALTNLQKVFAHISSIKMPNGSDPRMLRPSGIICNPTLFPRVTQLTNAKFIAQMATAGSNNGGGSADVEALISALGYGQPILAPEFAGFESDTTYFVIAEQVATSQLGAVTYVEREPFTIGYYTGDGGVNADLARTKTLEWQADGRNTVGGGHPYLLFKCVAGA